MRIEYDFGLTRVDVPRFSVQATEGPDKLFTLATLVLNILFEQQRSDIVFHSPNPDEPNRKIQFFKHILTGAPGVGELRFEEGESGKLGGVYFQWLSVSAAADTPSSGGGA
ncbi:MAG: hypothetical protein ACE5IL_05950 [Myxococcota bacterium]